MNWNKAYHETFVAERDQMLGERRLGLRCESDSEIDMIAWRRAQATLERAINQHNEEVSRR